MNDKKPVPGNERTAKNKAMNLENNIVSTKVRVHKDQVDRIRYEATKLRLNPELN